MAEGEPDENTWAKIRGILEKEKATYQETRQIFEEKEIKKGQMVLPVYIVDEDADEVRRNFEDAGYRIAFYSIDAPNSIPDDAFERIEY